MSSQTLQSTEALKLKNNITTPFTELQVFLKNNYLNKWNRILLSILLLIFLKFCNILSIKSSLLLEELTYAILVTIIIRCITKKSIKNKFNLFQLFQQSFKRLFNHSQQPTHNRLDILDVFRVVAICWIVVNHLGSEGRVDILERLPSAVVFKQAIHNNIVFGALLGNSALGVEIFLVLSGLLAARSWNRNNTLSMSFGKKYLIFIVRRYFRIIPSVAVFLLIVSSSLINFLLPR